MAHAQSDEAVDKVTKMNKKAVEEYENLNFEESRKILKEALDFCSQNGLDKHPVKARTHIHLGIVILAGFKQREVAIKQFRKALEIEPDIKLTKSLANPEVQEAFDEAVAGMGQPEKPDSADKTDKTADKAPEQKTEKAEKPADGGPITHDPIAEGTQGGTITVTAKVDINLDVKKMILAYRPDGASEFLGRVMKEVTQGNWTADIPATATAGNRVAYYLEAQGADENTLGTKGTADDPMIIALKGSGAPEKGKASGEGDKDDDDDDDGPHWFLGLGLGTGLGYATGNGEVNADSKVNGGFALASLGHLAPELGYFVTPNVLISLQLRMQLVSGVNGRVLDTTDPSCGSDHFCSPAKSAFAAFAKVAYLFGDGSVHPYLSGAVGGGQIRHVASFPALKKCGSSGTSPGTDECKDTILAGPIFIGPGGGFVLNASDNFAFTLGINTQLGFPDFTFNFDLNLGVAVEF
ncbi:MAG TPA: tetratricopeptide repeat protein [Polyangia bacterium]|nr:tetratricopeptide repeat protein [Polyangia bacterium]